MYVNNTEYDEFVKWKADREAKVKAAREAEERREDFIRQQRIDAALSEGIERGEDWTAFFRRTAAPVDLKERYEQLQQAEAEKAKSQDDLFMRGFGMGLY